MNSEFHAIILAAGSSHRMGFNKLLVKFNGQTVLEKSIARISELKNLKSLTIVSSIANLDTYRSLLSSYSRINFVLGGKTRQESVLKGINFLVDRISQENDFILVHDAARCLLSKEDLINVCKFAKVKKAVSVATKVVDTLKRADRNGLIAESISRENVWQLQTPQIFKAKLLIEAHSNSLKSKIKVTCDASLVNYYNNDVYLYQSKDPNFKLTQESDIELFKKLITN